MKRSKVVLIIMVIFILICLILNISYNKICLSSDTNINQNDYIFSPPWDYSKYYLYPVTYIDHNKLFIDQKDRTFGAVDLYYFKNKNMPNKYPENRYGDGGIEILAANDGDVFINLYYDKSPINTSDINWPRLNIINNNIDDKDIPFTSFKFNKGNKTYYIDMELGVKDKILKTYYVHLKIDLRFFSNIKNELKEEILYFYNNLEFSNNEDYKEIKTGVEVKEGEILGYMDKYGNASNPHLHFCVYDNGFINLKEKEVKFKFKINGIDYVQKIFDQDKENIINNYYYYPSMPRIPYDLSISSNYVGLFKGNTLKITAKIRDINNNLGVANVPIYCDDPLLQQCGLFGKTNINGIITKTYNTVNVKAGIYNFKFYSYDYISEPLYYTIAINNFYNNYYNHKNHLSSENTNIVLNNIKINLGASSSLSFYNKVYSIKTTNSSIPKPTPIDVRDSLYNDILPFLDSWMRNYIKNPANDIATAISISCYFPEPVFSKAVCSASLTMVTNSAIKNTVLTLINKIIDSSNLSDNEKNNVKAFLTCSTSYFSIIAADTNSPLLPLSNFGSAWSCYGAIVELIKNPLNPNQINELKLAAITKNNGPPDSVIAIRGINISSQPQPQIINLSNNELKKDLSDLEGGKKYFKINVPSGSTKLTIKTSGGSGDLDLYVKYGALPDLNNWDRRSWGNSNDELVTIDNPQSGDWYIMLYAYKLYSGVTLTVNYSTGTTSSGTMAVFPTTWSTTVNSGTSTPKEFTVSAINGNISGVKVEKINGPNWLSISQTDLGDISSGSSKTFNLILSPPLGTSGSYQYTVRLKCSSGSPSSIDITGTISVISQAQYGSMAGYVYNSSNNTKIQGAKVSLINTSLYAYTDSNGNYTINNIPAGTYTAKVEAQGYETKTESVTINSNQTLPKNFSLKPITTDITLKLYVHEDSSNGPLLSGVRIFGNDGGGNSFDRTTDNSGFVTISGKPGNWSFTASKTGYETKRWTKEITSSCERHEFISKALTPSFEISVDRGCGQTYKIGDTITVVGKSNVTATGTLYSYWSDGSVKTYSVQFKSNQMVTLLTSPISGATGKRVYKAKVTYNGVTYDSNECSINVVDDSKTLLVNIWVDKGCGSTYKLGESIKIYGKSNITTDATYIVQRPDGTWTHTIHLTADQTVLITEGNLSGPTGQRTYTLRVTYNGQTEENSCSINVVSNVQETGTINVFANLNGSSWSGSLSFSLSGSTSLSGNIVPYNFYNVPVGTYTITYISGGPPSATLQSITPSKTQTLSKGEIKIFTLNFVTQAQYGSMAGYVYNSSNNTRIQGAKVSLINTSLYAYTDSNGNYTINNIPAGTYTAKVEAQGYETKTESATINPNQTLPKNFSLKPITTDTPSFEISVDRGCGQTYKIGDTITVVGKSNVTATGTLYSYWSDGSVKTYSVQFKSNQMVTLLTSPISGATGKRVYKAKVTYNGVTYDSNECSINVVSNVQETGTINVFANLNGSSWSGSLSFSLSGSTSLSGNIVPYNFYNVPVGTYTITYISGGPPSATLQSITPSKTQTLSKGEIKIFTLNFVTQAQYGSMAGYVYNSSNNTRIQGAKVSLINTSLYAYTDSNGNYTINNIPAGTYTAKVEAQGYETKTESVTINSNQTLPKSFYLTPRSSATKPSPPRNLRVTSVGDSVVNLAWDPPSSDGGSQIISYKIYRGTCSGCEKEYKTIPSSYTTFQNIGSSYVVNGTTYYYYVTAINSVGESSPSNEVYATPRSSATKPSPPRNLNIIGVFSKETWKAGVYLTWEPPSSDGGSSITEYRMYRRNEGGSYYSIGRREAQYTHFRYWDNISLGGSYYFKITAVNSVGESDPSNEKYIYVTVTAKTESNVRVRTAPGLSSQEIITLPPGVYGVASRGPIYSDNYHWLYIKWNYNGKYYEGWSAGELCWFQTSPSNLTNSINSSKNLLYKYTTKLKTDEIKTIIGKPSKTLNLTEKLTIIIKNPCSFKFEICNLLCTNIYYYSFENFHKYYPRGVII